MASSQMSKSRLQIGDRVSFQFGRHTIQGIIVEDRGPVGADRQHFYRVQVFMDPDEPMFIELSEDEMSHVPAPEASRRVRKDEILGYLKAGGLIAILRTNTGGRNPPRVWLCRDNLGNITHTFVPERGLIGGRVPPFLAYHFDKVFKPRREEVIDFLTSFGLNRSDAEDVVREVGTAP